LRSSSARFGGAPVSVAVQKGQNGKSPAGSSLPQAGHVATGRV
jgi:hypothetical protein